MSNILSRTFGAPYFFRNRGNYSTLIQWVWRYSRLGKWLDEAGIVIQPNTDYLFFDTQNTRRFLYFKKLVPNSLRKHWCFKYSSVPNTHDYCAL